jgi:hypothetical protein
MLSEFSSKFHCYCVAIFCFLEKFTLNERLCQIDLSFIDITAIIVYYDFVTQKSKYRSAIG